MGIIFDILKKIAHFQVKYSVHGVNKYGENYFHNSDWKFYQLSGKNVQNYFPIFCFEIIEHL